MSSISLYILILSSAKVQGHCVFVRDLVNNVVHLGTLEHLSRFNPTTRIDGHMLPVHTEPFALAPAQAAARAKIAVNKIPRPRNAFIIYRMHKSPSVRAAHPKTHNNQICK
jgi:HMG (high mobility group) box